jgi:hypothetical protein
MVEAADEHHRLVPYLKRTAGMAAGFCIEPDGPACSSRETPRSTFARFSALFDFRLTGLINRPARLVYLSSGLHRGGEGSLRDLDWTKRTWDPAKAYSESKLQVVALAFAVARRWPQA